MKYLKGDMVYEGKAKKVYSVMNAPELVWIEYKDSLTAFNAQKKGSFPEKGQINCLITKNIYEALSKRSINHHMIAAASGSELVCKKVQIIPLEVVVRNKLAGSTAKKFSIEEGTLLDTPLVELYYKDDALGDPFVSDEQALFMKAAQSIDDLQILKKKALVINSALKEIFAQIGIDLIDFKLEFGKLPDGEIILADEITPDTCRLWDQKTGERLDKDRFRRDLGNVEESYRDILKRLQGLGV